MNVKRVLAGGLLAGLVLNIGETILNVPVIGKDFDAAMSAIGAPKMGGATIGLFVLMCFALGIFSVWLYTVMRRQYGAGPNTAILTGIVVWALAVLWPNIAQLAMHIMPARLVLTAVVWEAVEFPLAVLAGAWLYREEAAPAVAVPVPAK